ncbi:MAG: selenoneine biosynthesis selenosugar synthase SenB [Candidatus Binatia bacterium]|nr:selenoneine biosynthesis selenosugar synthase SenB [Candidatus Binatia bacterium]
MKITLITPAPTHARNGNSITALRWSRILGQLGHHITRQQRYDGRPCDLLVALHARRSYDSIDKFRRQHPDLPLIVVLTGTDLYRDIHYISKARRSLDLANRLIVLQSKGLAELPRHLQRKTRVIYQSAPASNGETSKPGKVFRVCVIGHLRPEKDPFRTASAARQLPASTRIRVLHVGRALSKGMEERARRETATNPHYDWVGEMPHWKARRVLSGSHLLALTSKMEGSSNVLSEAIASSVPVIASKISGLRGTLGEDYLGYFPVGDTRALAKLLQKAESNRAFYLKLKKQCASLFPLVDPKRELRSWKDLVRELNSRS